MTPPLLKTSVYSTVIIKDELDKEVGRLLRTEPPSAKTIEQRTADLTNAYLRELAISAYAESKQE